jgi:hypothetical protein
MDERILILNNNQKNQTNLVAVARCTYKDRAATGHG